MPLTVVPDFHSDDSRPATGSAPLIDLVREGTRRKPAAAPQAEVDACIAAFAQARWCAVNAPALVVLVHDGARFERGVLTERDEVGAA
ncbi:hypothetical protein ABZ860_12800 [Microbispora sp. NPDC046973]|uniref:hypothetical protein n=1 Tax=Microbispora sp. NPDC046973 TaxID=3155022 RepID=UPI0033E6CBD8